MECLPTANLETDNMPAPTTTQRPSYENRVNSVRDHSIHQSMRTSNRVSESEERKRDQNRIAQRTYRISILPSHIAKRKARSHDLRPGRNQNECVRSLEEAAGQRLASTKQHGPETRPTLENDQIWPPPPEEDFESSLSFPGLDFPNPLQTLSSEDKVT